MIRFLIVGFTLFASILCLGQKSFITEDSEHIFWQPNVKLSHDDFEGDTTTEVMNLCRLYSFTASASVGILSVLDVPKKKHDRGKKLEKVYFAPVFCKTESFALSQDTMQIAIQAVYFDICEYTARWARMELQNLQDSIGGYGTLWIYYSTIKKEMEDKKSKLFYTYMKEVIIDKKPDAYESWRSFYNEMLEKTKKWATKPEECYRLLISKPIEEGYERSETIGGVITDENN